ncbi:TIGR01620 family protein [Pseudoalteromonas sp. T1lg65]|uniref:TIGR01620 family protein n=1 Tax=Pseudoalteromonas sp. T1lg65 TaxID=2077101 RepID=UPI003F7B1D44
MTEPQKQPHTQGRRIHVDVPEVNLDDTPTKGKVIENPMVALVDEVELAEDSLPKIEKIYQKPWKFGLKQGFFVSFLLLVCVELVLTLIESAQQSWYLFSLYCTVAGLALILSGRFFIKEIFALNKLKKQQQLRSDAQRLLESDQIGEAEKWLTPLLKAAPKEPVEKFKSAIKPHHTDKEVIALYQQTVLNEQDLQAKKIIQEHATTSALLVALSPMALVDMLAVLWRGVVLVEKISEHYGLKLAYRSRINLYRLLLKQMVFVGATELVSDLAATSLGAELLGKLSARSAQGLSAGIFTTRLGYKAMELCRPLPRLEHKQSMLKTAITSLGKVLLKKT